MNDKLQAPRSKLQRSFKHQAPNALRVSGLEFGAWSFAVRPAAVKQKESFVMPKFSYVAMDSHGKETKGTLEVGSQNEAIGRVKEMGLFPTRIVEVEKVKG